MILWSELVRERLGNLSNELILHHVNDPGHRGQQAVQAAEQAGIQVLPHPANSPDLDPSDFFCSLN